jgi:hypothetical protein
MFLERVRSGCWFGLSGLVLFLTVKLWFGVNAAPAEIRATQIEADTLGGACRGADTVIHRAEIAIDGDVSEWDPHWFRELSSDAFVGADAHREAEGSARVALAWSRDALFVAIEVEDEAVFNRSERAELWQGDSVQLALDMGSNGGWGYDGKDDFELGWALLEDGPAWFEFAAPAGAAGTPGAMSIERTDDGLRYELAVPATTLGTTYFAPDTRLNAALVINDNDGAGRRGWFQTAAGVGFDKNPQQFASMCLGR